MRLRALLLLVFMACQKNGDCYNSVVVEMAACAAACKDAGGVQLAMPSHNICICKSVAPVEPR